jgi:hypothetical protein
METLEVVEMRPRYHLCTNAERLGYRQACSTRGVETETASHR